MVNVLLIALLINTGKALLTMISLNSTSPATTDAEERTLFIYAKTHFATTVLVSFQTPSMNALHFLNTLFHAPAMMEPFLITPFMNSKYVV